MQAGLKMSKTGKYVHLYASFSCSVNIYNTKEVLCALNLNSSECSHVGSFSLYQWRAEKGGLGIYIWCSLCSSERNHVGSLNLYQWRAEKGGFGMYFMLFMLLRVQPWWCTHSLPMKSRERRFGDIYLMLFMLLREEPCWFNLYQWRAEKGGFGMYFMLFMLLRVQPWWCTHSLPMKSRERRFGDIYLMLFMLLREEPCWFNLYQWRAEKGGFVVHLILLPCMLAMFMTSLTQTAGHKMAALMVMFSQPLNIDFEVHETKTRSQVDSCCLYFFLLFLLIWPIMFLWFSSLLTSVGWFISDVLNLLYV